MSRIRAVLFDYGETLVTVSRPRHRLEQAADDAARLISAALGHRVEGPAVSAVWEAVASTLLGPRRDLHELDHRTVARDELKRHRMAVEDDVVESMIEIEQRAWTTGVRLRPGALSTLDELRERGLLLGICSNAPFHSPSMHRQIRELGIAGRVDGITLSSDVGWRKPAAAIFDAALGWLQMDPSEVLMVGDRPCEDAKGALAVGMQCALLAVGDEVPTGVRPIGGLTEVVRAI